MNTVLYCTGGPDNGVCARVVLNSNSTLLYLDNNPPFRPPLGRSPARCFSDKPQDYNHT